MGKFNWPIIRNDASEYILNYSNNNLFLNHEYISKTWKSNIEEIKKNALTFS